MIDPKNGASGEKPAPPPQTDGSAAPAGEEKTTAEGAAPRRRRGARGGRRHKRSTPAAAAESPSGSSPRDGYTSGAQRSGAGDLPTTPLIPVAAVPSGTTGETAAPAAETAPAPTRRTSRGSRKAGSGRAEPAPPRPTATPQQTRETAPTTADSSAAPAAVVTPASDDATTGAAPRPTPVVAEASESTGSGASTQTSDDESGESAAKRRRRGSRGGRRRRRTADIEHEEATREAEEAAGEPAVHGPAADESAEPAAAVERAEPSAAAESARGTPEARGDAAVDQGGADGTPAEGAAKRRRRGGRGGRSKRATAVTAPDDGATVVEAPSAAVADGKADEAKPDAPTPKPSARKKTRTRDHRRPKAIVRQDEGSGLGTIVPIELGQKRTTVVAERPERKIILVTDDGEELRVALVEDGRLAEIYIERPDRKSYLGDIYQGRVDNVMNGIDAAFVDFGLEKNGFLYVDEVTTPEGEKRARRIGDALKNGQQVLVQVTKDPMGHKGARLSTKISLAGRYLVYVPGGSGVGVSRRLRQGERERLRDICKELKPKNAGLIVRTIAEGHGLEDLRRDMRYLSRLWSRLKKKAETVKPPGLVHKEVDISLEVTRDLFNDTCESLIVDDPKRHKAIVSFLEKEAPELLPKVHLHTGEELLFGAYGIEEQIAKALERRVPLPSGGNLVIDHAEALTVIDVNTGRFTRGKGLEDTITKTNLEAAREVVRQLRLRDIGGIIIIDFIDMAHAKNREMVLATLEAELETDRTKTYVVELSPLGLVEMTRQNTTDGARGILTRACPTCSGKARVLSEETMALTVERRVRALARKSQAKAWLIEVGAGVAERLSGPRLKRLEKQLGRRVFLEGGSALPVESFRVISEGSLEHVQEQRVPVKEGQEVTVELEFSLTYSPRDAVGYVDGYMIIVEGGRQHLGKRRRVRITEIARTGARATVIKKDAKEAN